MKVGKYTDTNHIKIDDAKAIEDELVRSEGNAKKVFDGVDAEGAAMLRHGE